LRAAIAMAEAIQTGAANKGQRVEVVLGHVDDTEAYPPTEFADLPTSISRRPFRWRTLSADEARRAMIYGGRERTGVLPQYQVPDDGIMQFLDCDFWIVVSDRLEMPLVPLRPYAMMVYDY